MPRKNITYNQPLEKEIGFARAVRVGNIIAVTGTAPVASDGSVQSPGNVYEQAKRSLEIIKDVIEKTGGRLEDVIRTRIFLKDISHLLILIVKPLEQAAPWFQRPAAVKVLATIQQGLPVCGVLRSTFLLISVMTASLPPHYPWPFP